MGDSIEIKFRGWIYKNNEKLLGKGRVELLERIRETGSILRASEEMEMSYRQAWQMVKEMNERSTEPVVVKKIGGRKGGGAAVTKKGEEAIAAYYLLCGEMEKLISKHCKTLDI